MKNFRKLCASAVLVLYALLAGASIDDSGDIELWFVLLCIAIAIGIIVVWINLSVQDSNLHEEMKKQLRNEVAHQLHQHPNFNLSKVITGPADNFKILIDTLNRNIITIHWFPKEIETHIFTFDDIISVEVTKNNKTYFSKSVGGTIGGALVGGVLGGSAGAVIGGLSSDTEINEDVIGISFYIHLRDVSKPKVGFVVYLKGTCDKINNKTELYPIFVHKANDIMDIFSVILDENHKHQVTNKTNSNLSISEELLKLSELQKLGILTQEEYESQKKKLLQ